MEDQAGGEEEKEEAGDMDDLFAMMSGTGEEEVYKVTLMEDQADRGENEEEEEAGEMGDPFAMMGGMVEEELYTVMLMEEIEDCSMQTTLSPLEQMEEEEPEEVSVR